MNSKAFEDLRDGRDELPLIRTLSYKRANFAKRPTDEQELIPTELLESSS
jgi:hypothetical protein